MSYKTWNSNIEVMLIKIFFIKKNQLTSQKRAYIRTTHIQDLALNTINEVTLN